jgi:hypothetical protein
MADSSGLSGERARENEEKFAEANETITARADDLRISDPPLICECSAPRCTEIILVPRDAYRRARDEGWFLLAPHHDDQAVERIVETTAAFIAVEKLK